MLQLKKVKTFLRAVWSFVRWGDAPLIEYSVRQMQCLKCPNLKVTATGYFCKACGCPESPVSDLRSKWRMRDMQCPLKPPKW